MTVLTTERLLLRPVASADEEELHALFLEPEVARYLLDGERVSREWVRAEIEASRKRFMEHGCGLWAGRLGSADEPILGVFGFRPFFDPDELQLLYALTPSAWDRSLATEGARAVVRYAFEGLDFSEVVAATDEPNGASIRVMERLGMTRWKEEDGEPSATITYRLERRDFTD